MTCFKICSVNNKHFWLQVVSTALTVAAFGYLVYRLVTYDDYAAFAHSFSTADNVAWLCLVVAVGLLPVHLMVEAKRWQVLLQGVAAVSLRASLRQVLAGYLGAFVTPYRLGEYPARLLEAGLDTTTSLEWKNWRLWLKDWAKWGRFLLWTFIRYTIWGLQLWAVLRFCGIGLTPLQAVCSIAVYYVLISIMPSLPAAEVPLKGGWAVLVFQHVTSNTPAIASAVAIIWVVNTIFPVLFAGLRKKL